MSLSMPLIMKNAKTSYEFRPDLLSLTCFEEFNVEQQTSTITLDIRVEAELQLPLLSEL